jgi:hypothetical protein
MTDPTGAVLKLTEPTALGPPGPMVGFHGRLKPKLTPDPALQASLDLALTDAETFLTIAATTTPGLPTSVHPFSFAVVDLTSDPRTPGFGPLNPAYAGHNDTRTVAIASLCKTLPLYAAHQLRSDARALASVTTPTTMAELADLMRRHHQRFGAADEIFPLFEDIFSIDATSVVDFKTGGARWPPPPPPAQPPLITILDLDAVDRADLVASPTPARVAAVRGKLKDSNPQAVRTAVQGQLADVAFREQLRLMAGWSNNVSASIVIQSIGFPYMWQLGRRSGLFRNGGWEKLTASGFGKREKPGGMFLGQDYGGNVWTKRPRGSNGAPVFREKPSQSGNARSVAQLMASLAGELINDEAHISMREMLHKTELFRGFLNSAAAPANTLIEASPIGMGMTAATRPWNPSQTTWGYGPILPAPDPDRDQLVNGELAVSKIGLLDPSTPGDPEGMTVSSNAVLVRAVRGTAAKPITVTAVLVGLVNVVGLPASLNSGVLANVVGAFGRAMAAQLDVRHPAGP